MLTKPYFDEHFVQSKTFFPTLFCFEIQLIFGNKSNNINNEKNKICTHEGIHESLYML